VSLFWDRIRAITQPVEFFNRLLTRIIHRHKEDGRKAQNPNPKR
jgi:hypothetical protein